MSAAGKRHADRADRGSISFWLPCFSLSGRRPSCFHFYVSTFRCKYRSTFFRRGYTFTAVVRALAWCKPCPVMCVYCRRSVVNIRSSMRVVERRAKTTLAQSLGARRIAWLALQNPAGLPAGQPDQRSPPPGWQRQMRRRGHRRARRRAWRQRAPCPQHRQRQCSPHCQRAVRRPWTTSGPIGT